MKKLRMRVLNVVLALGLLPIQGLATPLLPSTATDPPAETLLARPLFRTTVTIDGPARLERLRGLALEVLEYREGAAVVLADGDALARLGRLGFEPSDTNEILTLFEQAAGAYNLDSYHIVFPPEETASDLTTSSEVQEAPQRLLGGWRDRALRTSNLGQRPLALTPSLALAWQELAAPRAQSHRAAAVQRLAAHPQRGGPPGHCRGHHCRHRRRRADRHRRGMVVHRPDGPGLRP